MRKAIVSGLILAGLAGGIAAPAIVYGQDAAPGAPAAQTAPAPAQAPQRPMMHMRHRALPGERIDARLAYLKTALKITPAQEKPWNALAAVLRRQARDMDAKIQQRREERQAQGQTPRTPPTAIERLEQRQQFLADAAKRTNAILAAAKPLYAALSPEQQQTANELFGHDGRRGHHWRG